MLTVTKIFSVLDDKSYQESKKTYLPIYTVSPGVDGDNNPFAKVLVTAVTPKPHGSGRKHRTEVRVYEPVGVSSPVWVSCDCEYHLYNCEVALAFKGSSDIRYSNGEFPIIKNPSLVPKVCKHAVAAIKKALSMEKVKTAIQEAKELAKFEKRKDYLPKEVIQPLAPQLKPISKPKKPSKRKTTITAPIKRTTKKPRKITTKEPERTTTKVKTRKLGPLPTKKPMKPLSPIKPKRKKTTAQPSNKKVNKKQQKVNEAREKIFSLLNKENKMKVNRNKIKNITTPSSTKPRKRTFKSSTKKAS